MSKVKSLIWQEIKLIQFTSKQAAKIADNFFYILLRMELFKNSEDTF